MKRIQILFASLALLCGIASSAESFGGIGVTILASGQGVQVVDVVPGSPSAQAGVQTADLIVAVNEQNLAGLDLEQCKTLLRGPVGSELRITVIREETTTRMNLKRASLEVQNLTADQMNQWYGGSTDLGGDEIRYFAEKNASDGAVLLGVLQNGRILSEETVIEASEIQGVYVHSSQDEPALRPALAGGMNVLSLTRQTLRFELMNAGSTQIRLLSAQGQTVFQSVIDGKTGANTLEWDTSRLAGGHYTLRLDQQQSRVHHPVLFR